MNGNRRRLLLSALLLALLLLWRMLGAPVSAAEFAGLGTELWQARVLLPARTARMLSLWLGAPDTALPQNVAEDGADAYERELARLSSGKEAEISVYFADSGETERMPLESYVCGVLAAEMPARYHMEALKAQAVAARTRAVWQQRGGGCALCSGADICASSAHCQGYKTAAECREMWGAEYEAYRDRVMEAVELTRDELICYEGEPITVMYHAMSGGATENAQAVFSQALPYLVSVRSDGEESARGFETDTRFTFEEAAELLNKAFTELNADASDVRSTLAAGSHNSSGRVSEVLICGEELPATEVRSALGLRSTMFSITMDGEGVIFHQRGYGHGVGMSQVGANSMAANGADYREILTYYYTGAEVMKP